MYHTTQNEEVLLSMVKTYTRKRATRSFTAILWALSSYVIIPDSDASSESSVQVSSIQFNSVQDGIYALWKAHMLSTPSLMSFSNVTLETVPMLV